MVDLSQGQLLALHQLNEIAVRSGGALELLGAPRVVGSEGSISIRLSLATKGYRQEAGLAFRDREPLDLYLYPEFPFKKPDLYFRHKRFIGAPHVQWGWYICLYQSAETEYDPSDGLFGFFDRVEQWMRAAGSGQLDPEDAPLHPPVAYTSSETRFVIKANTPQDQSEGPYWIGRADLRAVRPGRFDVIGWTHLDDWGDLNPEELIAAAILFNQPLAMEYPSKVNDLINLVEAAGLSFAMFYRLLRLLALLTAVGEPAHFVLGAPMRRKAAGEPLRAHLTVWEIGAEPLAALRAMVLEKGDVALARHELVGWMVRADVSWCGVMEDRPEIVNRRDGGALLSTLTAKRVLLLGCGALGSAIAETVVRAGAASLHLVDYGRVSPGLLVRQRYADADIGKLKAEALKSRLDAIGLPCVVTQELGNLTLGALTRFTPDQFDFVIDATASAGVTHRIEEELKQLELAAPLLTLSVSGAASHGSLTVRMPGYGGGPHRINRQSKVEAFGRDADNGLVKAFWPDRSTIKVFQPEPGCSAPTFVGSSADIDYHAAGLLNLGILRIRTLSDREGSADLIASPWVNRPPLEAGHLHYVFEGYAAFTEHRHAYTVLQSKAAARGITTEIRRIGRTRSDKVETGGLIFGEVDDSHRYIWIDSVSGPPPGSQASETQFLCGTAGTQRLADFKAKRSGGSSKFVGIWHTHPTSRGRPSEDDLAAMIELLHFQAFPPRQVLMVIVGFAASTPVINYYLFRRDEFQLISLGAPQESGA